MPQVLLDRPDDEKLKEEGKTADEESKRLRSSNSYADVATKTGIDHPIF